MRISNFLSFYGALLSIALLSIWFSQQSIHAYWQLTYHQPSPLEKLERFAWWRWGAESQQYFSHHLTFKENRQEMPAEPEPNLNTEALVVEPTPAKSEPELREIVVIRRDGQIEQWRITEEEFQQRLAEQIVLTENLSENTASENPATASNETPVSSPESALPTEEVHVRAQSDNQKEEKQSLESKSASRVDNKVMIRQGDKVFFAGDSLMQGVAPIVAQKLKKQGINSINLSKQSTGLSYPSFFDWPKTIEQTLNHHRDIKVLMMFLGANDPWDFPNPKGGGRYLKFKSPAWEEVYLSRVERIVQACERRGVAIIWLGIPYMRKDKFNQQMRYLDGILQQHLQDKVLWLPTEALLSGNQNRYRDSITVNGKKQTVRAKDGIHFSGNGVRLLADYLWQHLDIQP